MKKITGNKLALHRETLASLNPDVLSDVAGGALTPLTTRPTGPTPVTSRITCQFICHPQQTRMLCPQGPTQK